MISRRAAVLAVNIFERYILSLVFFCFACAQLSSLFQLYAKHFPLTAPLFVRYSREIILLLLDCFQILFLVFSRRPSAPPENVRSIVVPLAATFMNVFYNFAAQLPSSWKTSVLPPNLQTIFTLVAIALVVAGPLIALWGLIYLGRSFGVFVAVRTVVLRGAYRWVRHPMYLGWILIYLGYALANFAPALILAVTIHISLLVYRAKLEEAHLAAHSPEYRQYMAQTGFLIPRFRSA